MVNLSKNRSHLISGTVLLRDSLKIEDRFHPLGFRYPLAEARSDLVKRREVVGAINELWQRWNRFCRCYFLLLAQGGVQRPGRAIYPVCSPSPTEEEALCKLLRLTGQFSSRVGNNSTLPHYREPTWGCYDTLIKILSAQCLGTQDSATIFISLCSIHGQDIVDLQETRNALIHPSKGTIAQLKMKVLPHYSVQGGMRGPTDVVFATSLINRQIAIERWVSVITQMACKVVEA